MKRLSRNFTTPTKRVSMTLNPYPKVTVTLSVDSIKDRIGPWEPTPQKFE